jgi:hypothetical protein
LPARLPVHDSVDAPEPPEIVAGVAHVRFVEFVVTVRVTVPVKLFNGETVIVEVLATPTLAVRLVGLAEMVKSLTWYVTVEKCDRLPLVPVTVAR